MRSIAADTKRVKDINRGSGGSNPHELTNVGGRAFFAADDGTSGIELWISDGTAPGTRRVKNIHP
jgi:ELWxxDGT repeat protein